MTDAEFRTQQRRVQRAYGRWHEITGMSGWVVCHEWHRDGSSGKDSRGNRCTATAQASISWEYLHATFKWNLLSIADHNDHELDRIVRHEICHALVKEMRMWGPTTLPEQQADNAMMHEERVVSQLAMVLRWVRLQGARDKQYAEETKGV